MGALIEPDDRPEIASYDDFVRAHWGRHPVKGPAPNAEMFAAASAFANTASALVVTLRTLPLDAQLFIPCMGLIGETGEIVEHLKKHVRDGVLDRDKLKLELGDAWFYLTRLGHEVQAAGLETALLGFARHAWRGLVAACEFTQADVERANVEKLEARYGRRV